MEFRPVLWFALLGAVAAIWLGMGEAESLLGMLVTTNQVSYDMSSLQGFHTGPGAAVTAMEQWLGSSAQVGVYPLAWITTYLICDTVFAAAYGLVLWAVLPKLFKAKAKWMKRLAVGVAAADVVENVIIGLSLIWKELRVFIFLASGIKWVLVLGVMLTFAIALVTWLPSEWKLDWAKVPWRFRIQALAVLILAVLVAMPSRDRLGALAQLPDTLRGYVGEEGRLLPDLSWFLWSGLALLGLAVAVWMSGHWLRFGPHTPGRTPEPWWREGLWIGILVLAMAMAGVGQLVAKGEIRADKPANVDRFLLGLPLVVGATMLIVLVAVHAVRGFREPLDDRDPWTKRHALILNGLTAGVIMCGGLGIVRAFTGPVMLKGQTDADRVMLVAGAVTAVVIAPGIFWALGKVSPKEWGDAPQPRRIHPVWTTLVLIFAAGLAFDMGDDPDTFGRGLGVNGTLGAALAAACLFLGGLVAAADHATPLWRWERPSPGKTIALPAALVALLLIVTLGTVDTAGTYHDVRLSEPVPNAAPLTTLQQNFDSWRSETAGCAKRSTLDGRPLQPMLIISAAGGGIRAAYWTESILNHLSGLGCGDRNIFLVSSVSGGSVGTALWSDPGATRKGSPRSALLADRRALGGVGSAWLFRDLPRSYLGFDPGWPDRAEILESAWIDNTGKALKRDFFEEPPGSWRPLIVFNATDLLTGCRVAVTRLKPPTDDAPKHCDDRDVADAVLPGTYYASQFTNGFDCGGRKSFSAATAAMLSARFPFVTPSGSMYACVGKTSIRIQVGDGGYLETSGQLTALQVWQSLQPLVAKHNREAIAIPGKPVIVPFFIAIGNSYRSTAASPVRPREPELSAPINARSAKEAVGSPARLEVEARATFRGALPGTAEPALAVCQDSFRFFAASPVSRPEVTAPLGWALSAHTQQALNEQSKDLWEDEDSACLSEFLQGSASYTGGLELE